MAVIVMAFGLRDTLAAAVRSVLDQTSEVVVVHSGPGDAAAALARAGLDVPVLRSETPLRPGGTRNLGIAGTHAPLVAFLADDCCATPGWVAARLAAHDAGARAVASALDCHAPQNPVALAAHLGLFAWRMPRTPARVARCYGASYDRALFDRHGLFREDLVAGEDTEFHQRLSPEDRPRWTPSVVTVHHGVERLGPFLTDQYQRGRRMARAAEEVLQMRARRVGTDALRWIRRTVRMGLRVVEPRHRGSLVLAIPLIAAGNIALALGAFAVAREGRRR